VVTLDEADQEIYLAFIVEGSRLDSLPIRRSRNHSSPSSRSQSRQRLKCRSKTPASLFHPRQLAPLMPPEQPFETHLPYSLQHLYPDPPPPPFRTLLKPDRSRATRTGEFTSRCVLGAPNLSIESTTYCSRASASILAAANGVIDSLSAISRTCLSFSLNKPTLVLTFCLS
jgi:hypothetical protein